MLRGGAAALVGIGIGLGAGAGAGGGAWFWLLTSRLEGGAGTGAWGLLITLTWFAMLGCGEALGGPGPPPAMAPRGLGGPGPALPVPGSSSLRAGGGPCAEERAPGPIPAPDSDNKAPEKRVQSIRCMWQPVKGSISSVIWVQNQNHRHLGIQVSDSVWTHGLVSIQKKRFAPYSIQFLPPA